MKMSGAMPGRAGDSGSGRRFRSAAENLFRRKRTALLYSYSLVLFAAASLIALAAVGFTYTKVSNVLFEEAHETALNDLQDIQHLAESVFSSTVQYLFQLIEEPSVRALVFSDELTDRELLDGTSRLESAKLFSPVIESLAAFNSYSGIVYSTTYGMNPLETFPDRQLIDFADDIRSTGVYRLIPGYWEEKQYFYLFAGNIPQGEEGIKGALVARISEIELRMLLAGGGVGPERALFIFDSGGTVISGTAESLSAGDSSAVLEKISADGRNEGFFMHSFSGEPRAVTFFRNPGFSWLFVMTTDRKVLLSSLSTVRNRIIWILSFIMVSSLVSALFLSKRFYRPISGMRELAEEAELQLLQDELSGGSGREDLGGDEVSYVQDVLRQLLIKTENLKAAVEQSREGGKRLAARSLLITGTAEETLSVTVPSRVVVMRLDRRRELFRNQGYSEVQLKLQKIARSIGSLRNIQLAPIFIHPDQIVFIQKTGSGDEDAEAEKLTRYSDGETEISFTVGVGPAVTNSRELMSSYRRALGATDQRFRNGGARVHISADTPVPESGRESRAVSEHVLQPYIEELRAGSERKAYDLLASLAEEVKKGSFRDFQLTIDLLFFYLQGQFTDDGFPKSAAVLADIGQERNLIDTAEEFKDVLMTVHRTIFSERNSEDNQKTHRLGLQIQAYIDEHLTERELCSKLISDDLSISTQYLRSVFRKYFRLSVSDYINQKRIELCRSRLSESDLPLKQIYTEVGFSNYNYFFALFKKYTGMTPVEYKRSLTNPKS
jgi:two-component system, response regulator YesN